MSNSRNRLLSKPIDACLSASIFMRMFAALTVALIVALMPGCSATSGTVSLLETENRVLKEQKSIQEQEIADYRRTTTDLAARLNQTEIELARTVEQVQRR